MSSAGLIADPDDNDNEDNNEVGSSTRPAPVQLSMELEEESSGEDLEAQEAFRKFKVCFKFYLITRPNLFFL